MPDIRVIAEKCIACGLCESCCPQNAIIIDDDIAKIGPACNLCGTCIEGCPNGAIEKTGPKSITEMEIDHLKQCKNLWVFTELRDGKIALCTFELLGEARRLVNGKPHQVAAVLFTDDKKDYADALIAGGADIVYVVEDPALKYFRDQPYASLMCELIREEKPLCILYSATAMGRTLAPRIAARIHTGLSADCTSLELCDNGILIQTRPAFGGNLFASILCPNTWPQMATVRAKVMKPIVPDSSRKGRVVEKHYSIDESKIGTKVLEYIQQVNEAAVDEAEVVVAAGYGAADARGLELVGDLAKSFGAALGASRKLIDAGLINYEKQIGQTGKTVAPELYIACGISGAVQHLVGISSSKTIVAIDQDQNAPIFQEADIGIVADLYEFLPKLIAAKQAENGKA